MLNLGAYEHSHGDVASAIQRYEFVAQHAGSAALRAKAYANLGSAYRQVGDPAKAKHALEMSLEIEPAQPSLMVALGVIAERDGNLPEAIQEFEQAMRLQPTDVGYLLLGNALLEQGGHDNEANAMLQRAARMSKNIDAAQKQAQALVDGK